MCHVGSIQPGSSEELRSALRAERQTVRARVEGVWLKKNIPGRGNSPGEGPEADGMQYNWDYKKARVQQLEEKCHHRGTER